MNQLAVLMIALGAGVVVASFVMIAINLSRIVTLLEVMLARAP